MKNNNNTYTAKSPLGDLGVFLVFCLMLFAGCSNLLEREIVLNETEDMIKVSYTKSQARVNMLYTYLPRGFLYIDGAMMASATDEAEHTQQTSKIQQFNTGAWDAVDNPDNISWDQNFLGIRNADLLLQSLGDINLDYYKLDPNESSQQTYRTMMENMNRWKSEARFLRAFFYFELVKRYGGVPVLEKPLTLADDFKSLGRNTLEECIHFIVDECDTVTDDTKPGCLPVLHEDADFGRATKGAALALKSRVLLYAASDLFNDPSWAGGYAEPELISLPNGKDASIRTARWKAAADAAKAVIDLERDAHYLLSLTPYPDVFAYFSTAEIIFSRREGYKNDFEIANYPISFNLGRSGTTPSQNLVDDYEMLDGSAFDWNNPAHAANPYENRDPRLEFSIMTNNSSFKDRPVECWAGGRDGAGVELATLTGYYIRKYQQSLDLLNGKTGVHAWVLFRLGEIYLNYAEALNECDPGHADIKKYVDNVRQRMGVRMPRLASDLTQAEMREKIRHERRIEMAFEDHRFWDVRRWMIAEETLGAPVRGVDIQKTGENTFVYKPIKVEDRRFETKMYFYPIPQSEISIARWPQNPLW
ncbi:MAG: RagB/SusD family nutrient uptake outer membrane protein [Candidatus Symbiothrix sp.]|jgi:hypothetical protein|nr:RagB/SusD family nutrient uptake outer membrane protein [Candidatus Symbiothrix sp.]